MQSDIPVLREIAGDTPRYFDPSDPAAICRPRARRAVYLGPHGSGNARGEAYRWLPGPSARFEASTGAEETAALARIHTYESHRQASRSRLPVVRRRRLALERVRVVRGGRRYSQAARVHDCGSCRRPQ
jgi:hypothetical protein